MKYIDAHCHPNFPQFSEDREEMFKRAEASGVGMIIVGTTKETSELAVSLARAHKNVWAIVGLHPIRVGEEVFDPIWYEQLAGDPKVVGLGECGFDFFRPEHVSYKAQAEVFDAHISIAGKVKKPLMLHLRSGKGAGEDAYDQAITFLRERKSVLANLHQSGDAHFFAGTKEQAGAFLDLGFSISFTGVITFARDYDEVVRSIPRDRILAETDSPFVAPAPYRGKRNEPAYVIEVAHALADIRGEDRNTFLPVLVSNTKETFKLDF